MYVLVKVENPEDVGVNEQERVIIPESKLVCKQNATGQRGIHIHRWQAVHPATPGED